MKLTPQQEEVQLFIQRTFAATGHTPRLDDIIVQCESVGSKTMAHRVVSCLIARGYLERTRHVARGLTILKWIPDDRFEEAAKAACAAAGLGADKVSLIRDAIASTLMRAA